MAEYEDEPELDDDVEDLEEAADVAEQAVETSGEPAQREVAKENRALVFLTTHHPECRLDYQEQVLDKLPLTSYPPDHGRDSRHTSVPYLTTFEKTKLIGLRATMIAKGSPLFIERPPHVTDVLELARMEVEQKKVPVILKRLMPDGTFEYWRLSDLLVV
jgi:DNA-directed RNA polymerase subunit K/omega